MPVLQASVRMSGGTHVTATQTRFATTASNGWALPAGDWTIGVWDNNFQGDGGVIISGPIDLAYVRLGRDLAREGRFMVGGKDSAGNLFGSGAKIMQDVIEGTLPVGYPGRITGKFTPRLHIIRRNAGKSEYLVAEAGHAPVLVCSETRTFTGTTAASPWALGAINGTSDLYDSDVEGFFFATASVSDADIGLMAAGCKPSSVSSLSGNLKVYYPLETAQLASATNPLTLANQGSDATVVFQRQGAVANYRDGPMLRGATTENDTPAQVTEPTNVVSLNSFQPFQIIRHLNGAADIQFKGIDHGVGAGDIEIRFIHVEKGTSTPWQTLMIGAPGGGAAIQPTVSVPKGYWKTIELRRVNSAGGTGDSNRPIRTWSRWAVGEVVVVWGDSIQGQVESTGRASIVAPNGFTAKYPSNYPNRIQGDPNPLSSGMWNLYRGTGMGGGTQGENEIANNLSDASQCCVGITVKWSGATRLAYWNGRLGSTSYDEAKAFCLANDGLNKPNVITWVSNLASAKYSDDFYQDLELFKNALNADFGEGTWRLVVAPVPVIFNPEPVSPTSLHMVRDATWRWVRDNAACASYGGVFLDHLTYDGVHPTGPAWDIMGPRWGAAVAHMRAPLSYADPRAGEIVKFYRAGTNLIAGVQLYAGTALGLKNEAATISGFTLSSDNFATTIPITSATLINGTTVRIVSSSMPAGTLKLRYQFGRPGASGTTAAELGVDNLLYINAGPANLLSIQPIWGTAASSWAMVESAAPPSPAITTSSLPGGTLGTVYSHALTASGGVTPYTWTVLSGSLPAGLSLGSSGVISGTPTAAGTSSFTISVSGGDGLASTGVAFSLVVSTPYANWQGGQFTPEEITSGLTGATEDFDHDGVDNLLEYAFGGNPKSPDAVVTAPVAEVAGGALTISFPCDAERTDITYTVQASSTLAETSWIDIAQSIGGAAMQPIGALSQVVDSGEERRTVTVTDSRSLTGSGRSFLRVKITTL